MNRVRSNIHGIAYDRANGELRGCRRRIRFMWSVGSWLWMRWRFVISVRVVGESLVAGERLIIVGIPISGLRIVKCRF